MAPSVTSNALSHWSPGESAHTERSDTFPSAVLALWENLIAPAPCCATFHRLERLSRDLIGRCHDCQNCNEEIGVCGDCRGAFLCGACFKTH